MMTRQSCRTCQEPMDYCPSHHDVPVDDQRNLAAPSQANRTIVPYLLFLTWLDCLRACKADENFLSIFTLWEQNCNELKVDNQL